MAKFNELKVGDVVVVHDTRNFYNENEPEQDEKINGFPIPLGVVDRLEAPYYPIPVRLTIYRKDEEEKTWWFEPESLEVIGNVRDD